MLTLSFSTPDYPLPAFPLVETLEFLQGAGKACLPREALPDTCAASPRTLAVASAIALCTKVVPLVPLSLFALYKFLEGSGPETWPAD